MIISDYRNRKVVDYLKTKRNGKALLIFRHGLGDIINFFPIFEELKRIHPEWIFNLGLDKDRNLSFLHKNTFEYDRFNFKDLHRRFTFFFSIFYKEPYDNLIDKPTWCNLNEIGLKNFIWKPYKMVIKRNEIKDRVGVHFFGSTNQTNKSLNTEEANMFWNNILTVGKKPFEIHNPKHNVCSGPSLGFDFDKTPNTIRFNNPNIKEIINEINKCEFFIGIDSGILYLATTILGVDKCIGIEKNYRISKYFPYELKTIKLSEISDFDKLKNLFKEN